MFQRNTCASIFSLPRIPKTPLLDSISSYPQGMVSACIFPLPPLFVSDRVTSRFFPTSRPPFFFELPPRVLFFPPFSFPSFRSFATPPTSLSLFLFAAKFTLPPPSLASTPLMHYSEKLFRTNHFSYWPTLMAIKASFSLFLSLWKGMSSLFKHREITYSIYSPSIYSTFHDPSLKLYGNDARSFGSFDQRYDPVFNVATMGQSRKRRVSILSRVHWSMETFNVSMRRGFLISGLFNPQCDRSDTKIYEIEESKNFQRKVYSEWYKYQFIF